MSCTAPLFLFFRNSMLLETLGWPCDRGDFAPIPRPSLLENWTSSAEVDVSPRLRLVAGELAIIFWGDQRDFNEHAAPQKRGKFVGLSLSLSLSLCCCCCCCCLRRQACIQDKAYDDLWKKTAVGMMERVDPTYIRSTHAVTFRPKPPVLTMFSACFKLRLRKPTLPSLGEQGDVDPSWPSKGPHLVHPGRGSKLDLRRHAQGRQF